MRKLSGPEWFEKYRHEGEKRSHALNRLQLETGIEWKTLHLALVIGARVGLRTVDKLVKASGGERLDRAAVLTAPTEDDARRAAHASGRLRKQKNTRLDSAAPQRAAKRGAA